MFCVWSFCAPAVGERLRLPLRTRHKHHYSTVQPLQSIQVSLEILIQNPDPACMKFTVCISHRAFVFVCWVLSCEFHSVCKCWTAENNWLETCFLCTSQCVGQRCPVRAPESTWLLYSIHAESIDHRSSAVPVDIRITFWVQPSLWCSCRACALWLFSMGLIIRTAITATVQRVKLLSCRRLSQTHDHIPHWLGAWLHTSPRNPQARPQYVC